MKNNTAKVIWIIGAMFVLGITIAENGSTPPKIVPFFDALGVLVIIGALWPILLGSWVYSIVKP